MSKVVVAPEQNTDLTLDRVHLDRPLAEIAAQAWFMEEPVTIEIAPSSNENDAPCVVLSVNGVNQPVWRGVATAIKRKYLEVLARMKETRYTQRPTDYINPELSNALLPRTGQSYPFQVVEDANPKGRAWLRQIMAEAG